MNEARLQGFILPRLKKIKKAGKQWTALCPAHDDSKNSLSIGIGANGKILLKCFAGCSTESICQAINIEVKDLFMQNSSRQPIPNSPRQSSPPVKSPKADSRKPITISELAADKGIKAEFLAPLCVQMPTYVRICYWMEDGTPAKQQRKRLALKAKDGSLWEEGKGSPVPYGLWKLTEWKKQGYLCIGEGESDCWTVWPYNIPMLGIPGADMIETTLRKKHVQGFNRIYVIQEADEAGEKFAKSVVAKLAAFGYLGIVTVIDMQQTGVEDINDLYKQDPAGFLKKFRELLRSEEPEPLPNKQDINLDIEKLNVYFQNYALDVCGNTDSPMEYILASFLTSISAAIGNKAILSMGKRGLAPNLYTIIIGNSTYMRKTTAIDYGSAALQAIDTDRKRNYFREKDAYDAEIEEWSKLSKKERGEKPEEPKDYSRIYPNDTTPEMLIKKMQSRPDGIFIASEMGTLLAKMQASYSNGMKEMMTELYDYCPIYTRETKSSGSFLIEKACFTLLAGSTFQWLQKWLSEEDLLSGFLGRFCFVVKRNYPKPIAIQKRWKPDPSFVNLFQKLDKMEVGELSLSPEAEQAYTEWFDDFRAKSVKEEVFLHSFLGRLETTCHKIAIINHVLTCARTGETSQIIEAKSYEQAFEWVRFFAENIKNCWDELTTQDLRERKVIEVIKKRANEDGMVASGVVARFSNMRKKELDDIIATLVEKNYVKEMKKGRYRYFQIAKHG